jgi:hypothetical protein
MGRGVEGPGPRVERKCAPFACGVFCILHEATLPRIVIDPESGLINPLSIFNSAMLIRAFPRRLTLRATCGSVDSLVPTRLTLRAALRQSPVQPPGCLGPSGCLSEP